MHECWHEFMYGSMHECMNACIIACMNACRHAVVLALLPLNIPALVPGHVGGSLNHVVTVPSGDGDEGNSGGVVANLLDETGHLLLDLLEPGLGVGRLGGV